MSVLRRGLFVLLAALLLAAASGGLAGTRLAAATSLPAGFEETLFEDGLSSPTAMEFAPDGRLFVAEQATGKLRVIKNGELLADPFLTVSVVGDDERGLLGVSFDPQFQQNRYVYIYYSASATRFNRLSRFTASESNPDVAVLNSEVVILDNIVQATRYHHGGAIHFGPDGMLYVAVGDAHTASSSNPLAQDLTKLGGKILRIDPSRYPQSMVPPDNPFVNDPEHPNARGEIWASGLRNPFTFAIEPGTGKIHINDVGQNTWEEINLGIPGANYGWPTCEGPYGQSKCADSSFEEPIHSYQHVGGACAITGGAFYRDNQFPAEYDGSYFFVEYCGKWIKRLTSNNSVVDFATNTASFPVDLNVGPDGSLYYLSYTQGKVYRIKYVGAGNRNPTAIASAEVTSGELPLTVHFDASASDDPDGDTLAFTWDFDDGSPTGTGALASHEFASKGKFDVMLTVEDGNGGSDTDAVAITVGLTPPVAVIILPIEGAKYNAGDTIQFEGAATDEEDGELAADAFSWTVLFHHDQHTHPFMSFDDVKDGSFDIPTDGETSDNVWFRVYLTVADSSGLTHEATRDVSPNKSTMLLAASPPGLKLTLDGQPFTAPQSVVGVVGMTRSIGAPTPQGNYELVSWSDGGAAVHDISTPADNATYTAAFVNTAATATIAPIAPSTVVTGSQFDALIQADQIVDAKSVQLALEFDEVRLTFTGAEPGEAFVGCEHEASLSAPGRLVLALACDEGRSGAPLVLWKVTFGLAQDAGAVHVELNVSDVALSDSFAQTLPSQGEGDAAPVIQGVCGDLSGDSIVSILDVATGLQIAVALFAPTPTQLAVGDLSNDGKIDLSDALMGLQHVVRLLPTLDRCGPLPLAGG